MSGWWDDLLKKVGLGPQPEQPKGDWYTQNVPPPAPQPPRGQEPEPQLGPKVPTWTTAGQYIGQRQKTYWENPRNVQRWFNQVQANPATPLPEGMDAQTLKGMYGYMQYRNGMRPPEQWVHLADDDPFNQYLQAIPQPAQEQLTPAERQLWKPPQNAAAMAAAASPAVLDWRSQQFDWQRLTKQQKAAILKDPTFRMSEVIAPSQQGLILSDKQWDWSKVPGWQRVAYGALSNPKTAPLGQALLMGGMATLSGGIGAGVLAGGGALAMGYGAPVAQWGDEQWKEHNNPLGGVAFLLGTAASKVGLLLMFGAQTVEQAAGEYEAASEKAGPRNALQKAAMLTPLTALISEGIRIGPEVNWQTAPERMNGVLASIANYFKPGSVDVSKLSPEARQGYAGWEANKSYYETRPGAVRAMGAVLDALHSIGVATDKQAQNAVYVIGEKDPVMVRPGYTVEDARKRILDGESAESVFMDYQREYGVSGIMSDFTMQAAFDPLNVAPHVIGDIRADVGEARYNNMAQEYRASGVMTEGEAAQLSIQRAHITAARVKPSIFGELLPWSETSKMFRDLVRANPDHLTTQALAAALSPSERVIVGLTPDGMIRELTKPAQPTIRNLWGAFGLQRKSQAILSGRIAFENVGMLLNWVDDAEVARGTRAVLDAVGKQDMRAVREAGAAFMDNPEMYTTSGAVRDFMPQVESRAAAYEAAVKQRQAILRVAEVLQADPHEIVARLATGDVRDFEAFVRKGGNLAEIATMLGVTEADITPDFFARSMEVFKNGRVEITPQEFKANLLGDLEQHMGRWGAEHFQVDPHDSTVVSVFKTLKNVQNMALLDFSPAYYINNMVNENILLAAGGCFNFEGEAALDRRIERFGVRPANWGEGGTAAGYEARAGSRAVDRGILQRVADGTGDLRRKVGLFNNLTGRMNAVHSKRAYIAAMDQFYGKTWRVGRGFDAMSPQLEQALRSRGIDPKMVYRAIEGRVDPASVGNIIQQGVNNHAVETYLADAAERMGLDAEQAGTMLTQLGVMDELRDGLAQATTPEERGRVFDRVQRVANEAIDVRDALEIRVRAEHFANTVRAEGYAGAHNVILDVQQSLEKRWLDHYMSAGELQAELAAVADPRTRSALWRNWRAEDQAQWRRYYTYEASAWKGMLDGLGISQPNRRRFMGLLAQYMDVNQALTTEQLAAYDRHFSTDFATPEEGAAAWKALEATYDKKWQQAEQVKANVWRQLDDHTAAMYADAFGPEIGANARRWVDAKSAYHAEMVRTREAFRASLEGMSRQERAAARRQFYQTTYPDMIRRFTAQNMDDQGRLYKTPPSSPQGGAPAAPSKGARAVDRLMAERPDIYGEGEQRQIAVQREGEKLQSLFDVAENYPNRGVPFDRGVRQDRFALLAALRDPRFGGFEDITGFTDPRVTPDFLKDVLDKRMQALKIEPPKAEPTVPAPKARTWERVSGNTTILRAIATGGGIDIALARDITGEARPRSVPGLFRKKGYTTGWGLDEMARGLAEQGYHIDLNAPDDNGGVRQATDLIRRAMAGEKIYPDHHDFSKEIEAQAEAYYADLEQPTMEDATWQRDYEEATANGDVGKMVSLIEQVPPEKETLYQSVIDAGWNKVAGKSEADLEAMRIAHQARRAAAAMEGAEQHGQAVMTRQAVRDQFAGLWGVDKADQFTQVTDALAEWYERTTGESGDNLYSRYYADVTEEGAGPGALYQDERIQPVNRAPTPQEVENYARMLTRAGYDELRRAVQNEGTAADRIALLDAAHKINPKLAEQVAKATRDVLYQEGQFYRPKGAVSFDAGGVRGTIHAFENRDFSTLVHENAHIFRRVLGDVAQRTNDARVRADLTTLEEWAGVKDGVWRPEHEEKFARGFEQYLAEGKAPTPKLARAFESFKQWMLEIYKKITGSQIDVNITDDVRAVFDRMLGSEKPAPAPKPDTFRVEEYLRTHGDRRLPQNEQLRQLWPRLDETQRTEVMNWIADNTMRDPVTGLETRVAMGIAGNKPPEGWVEARSDLNALKGINDKLGHDAGDQVLAQLGRVVQDEMGKAGGRSFRMGGDEITYWFPDEATAKATMQAIDARFKAEAFEVGGKQRKGFSISYGIGEKADALMYADKARRRTIGEAAAPGELPPSILFQDGGPMPVMPGGGYDQLTGYMPMSQLLAEGWHDQVRPLLEAMQESSRRPENRYSFEGLDPATNADLNAYMQDVRGKMASTKHAALRYGETMRDYAMLNYSRQYNVDKWLSAVMPYEFFATRSAINWIPRMMDHPAWGANLARLRNLHNVYESQLPERLRNKYFIPMPFLPKWMGGGVYTDPTYQAFPFSQFVQPFDAYGRDQRNLANSATYILRQWGEDGTMTPEAANAAMVAMSGKDWERAMEQARADQGENLQTGADYMSTITSPALYLTLPYYFATGKKMGQMGWPAGQLPVTRSASAMQTAFRGTSLEWLGDAAGMLAKPEQMVRQARNLSEFGEYGDYYIDRQIANLVADGRYDAKTAQKAMIERSGPAYDEAMQRVREELMLKVPGMAPLYGLGHGATLDKVVGAALPSLFPDGILPPGEMEYKGLKQEYGLAWEAYKNGDKNAISAFFDQHPEYQARLALRRDPQERLTQFLRSNIWDQYNALGPTNRKQVTAQMGPEFEQFLSADPGVEFSTEQLARWSTMLHGMTPEVPDTQTGIEQGQGQPLNYFSPEVTAITDKFYATRRERFPHYYALQQSYYSLPPSERGAFLLKFPELKDYMQFRDTWYKAYPDLKPVLNGEAFRRVDTSGWPPAVLDMVTTAALTDGKLPAGVGKMLRQYWAAQGKPNGDFDTWLQTQLYPSLKNDMMQGMVQ